MDAEQPIRLFCGYCQRYKQPTSWYVSNDNFLFNATQFNFKITYYSVRDSTNVSVQTAQFIPN